MLGFTTIAIIIVPGDRLKEEENHGVARGRKDRPSLQLRVPDSSCPPQLKAAAEECEVTGWEEVVWQWWGSPESLPGESCLTSAWQRLVPALRAHESQGGLGHVCTEGHQLRLTNIGPELPLRTECEAVLPAQHHATFPLPAHRGATPGGLPAHPRVPIHTLPLLPISLPFVRLPLEAPHRRVPNDSGLSRQRGHSRGLVLWAVEVREWGPGRCLIFLFRERTRPSASEKELRGGC